MRAEATNPTAVAPAPRGAVRFRSSMAETILLQGPGWTIVQSDTHGPAVPYPAAVHDNGANHGFIDLRDRPELVALIPEVQRANGLAELLREINAPGSALMSMGCECSLFETTPEGEPACYVGGYVDVTFRDPARNVGPALIELAKE